MSTVVKGFQWGNVSAVRLRLLIRRLLPRYSSHTSCTVIGRLKIGGSEEHLVSPCWSLRSCRCWRCPGSYRLWRDRLETKSKPFINVPYVLCSHTTSWLRLRELYDITGYFEEAQGCPVFHNDSLLKDSTFGTVESPRRCIDSCGLSSVNTFEDISFMST